MTATPLTHEETVFLLDARASVAKNQSATSALIGVGLLLIIIAVFIQIIVASWYLAIGWGLGILLILIGIGLYVSGSGGRSCLRNPRLCKTIYDYQRRMDVYLASAADDA
jgi:hypothetical protein